jgi:hypothetical protein
MPKYFTLEEATALLPEVRPILEEIVDLRARLNRAERDIVALHWKARTNGHTAHEGSFTEGQSARNELLAEISARVAHLNGMGVELKDPAIGLVDFLTQREGRDVYLCWRLGESAINFWHELDTGFAGRQAL